MDRFLSTSLRQTALAVPAERLIQITVSSTSRFDAWRERWWPGESDPGIVGNSADPDGDSLSNLYEYGLGFDPTQVSTEERPTLSKEMFAGKTWLVYTMLRRTDDPTLTVDVVSSGDPALPQHQWTAVSDLLSQPQDEVPPGFERIAFRDSVALEDAPRGRYLRIRVQIAN